MGFKCLECKKEFTSQHLPSKCPNPSCNNTDIDKFIRIEDKDFKFKDYEKDKGWLEERLL